MNINKYLIKSFIAKNSLFISYLLYSLIFRTILSAIPLNTFGNYIKAFELKDGNNILMFTEKGIFLYNKATEIFVAKKNFTNPIDLNDFDLITIEQFDIGNNYIIVLYKEMIYIFTKDGELFIESGVSFDTYGKYFALVPYTIKINEDDSNDYSFIVGYLKKKTYAYSSSDLIIN